MRSHIGLKSGTGVKKLRLYVDCRGNAKRARLQAKWAAIKEEQKARAAQMPSLPKAKAKTKGYQSRGASSSAEMTEAHINAAMQRILRQMAVAQTRVRGREGGMD